MTVRFKCQSEYQKSYRVPRSRSVSPQRCAPLAGLRSDQMGLSREPGLQRRRRLGPGGLAQSCGSLLCPPDPQHTTAPPAASRSRSAHRKESSMKPNPPTPPGARADPGSPVDPEPPAGPRPAADPEPSGEPGAAVTFAKPHPSKHDSQPQLSRPFTAAPDGQQPSANEVQHALRWRAGLRTGGQRSGSHRSEYHRQFSWKKPAAADSPMLSAEQMLHSSSRSVPPFKKHPVPMETEYQRSFQGLAPPAKPRLRKHLEHHHNVPLFHTHTTNKKRRQESEKKLRPKHDVPAPRKDDTMPPSLPPQVQRGHRMLTEYESSFRSPLYRIPEGGGATDGVALQVKELRQKALSYRLRAWGANFSRDHLSQLLSENNALWEPSDTTDSATAPPTPRLTVDLCHDADRRSTSPVEALDLASHSSNSSKRLSVTGSGNKNTETKAQTPPSPSAERRSAWGEEEEKTDEEEGRLPTPRLKIGPVQRTHHDLTTPATGGAILVGKLKSSDESSPYKQRCGSAVSLAAGAETAVDVPIKPKVAWPDSNSTHLPSSSSSSSSSPSGPAPDHKPASSPASKPIRTKQTPLPPVAPPLLVPPPQHCIQGTLRHADFQHNGDLGLRFRELHCSGGGCGSDEDERLSVMSWRSAASCSVASSVLERAQKRRENFWGKR
ncbi:nuclear protein MDM1 [Sander lucioperca]|uniref:nuclear protein MDM1 n=1 Tax=Sander lucioperca TaxID=283035 RepID=UPI0016535D56|nr:nuclear protein MDM1 [Sander lucioperca]